MGITVARILPGSLSAPSKLIYDMPFSFHATTTHVVGVAAFSGSCPPGVRRFASSTQPRFFPEFLKRKTPLAVVSLLREYEFSDAQICSLATQESPIFTFSATKNLLPKFKFFRSIGLSNADIHKLVGPSRRVIASSLANNIIPCYNFLRGIPLADKQITRIVKHIPSILGLSVETLLSPNVELLRKYGVSESSITSLMLRFTGAICRDHEKFRTFINQVIAMGLRPSTGSKFVSALHVVCALSKDTWERKLNLFKRYGFGDGDVTSLFCKEPGIMGLSETSIERRLKFFINKLGRSPAMLARTPVVLRLSFERRVLPRCLVMEKLGQKGLASNLSPSTFLVIPEAKFLERCIYGYEEVMPELPELYSNAIQSSSKNCA